MHSPPQPRRVTPSEAVPEGVGELGRELVGYRRGSGRATVGSRGRPRLAKGGRSHTTGSGPERTLEHRPDVVDGLARSLERTTAQFRVVVGIRHDALATPVRVQLIGGRSTVQLVEGAFAEDRDDVDSGRASHALVEVEIRVAATGHREAPRRSLRPARAASATRTCSCSPRARRASPGLR